MKDLVKISVLALFAFSMTYLPMSGQNNRRAANITNNGQQGRQNSNASRQVNNNSRPATSNVNNNRNNNGSAGIAAPTTSKNAGKPAQVNNNNSKQGISAPTNNNAGNKNRVNNTVNNGRKVNNPATSNKKNNQLQAKVNPPKNQNYVDERQKKDGGRRNNSIGKPNYVAGVAINPPVRQNRPKTLAAPKPIKRPSNYTANSNVATLSNVLGLAFYSSISTSLNYFYNNNYYIDGYNDNAVYLRNVSELGYEWDDVQVNYTSSSMTSVQFIASTSTANESRFNAVYNKLCNKYGDPVSLNYSSSEASAAWYGRGYNNYVTLDYYKDYSNDGQFRYYTVLTYCTNQ